MTLNNTSTTLPFDEIDRTPFSQPVGRGKVSGDVQQDFGSLGNELRIPVTFTREGPWKADVEGWSSTRNVRALASLEAVVVPVSKLGPAIAGAPPRIIARTPDKDEREVEPATQIRISFSEPLASVSPGAFSISQDCPSPRLNPYRKNTRTKPA